MAQTHIQPLETLGKLEASFLMNRLYMHRKQILDSLRLCKTLITDCVALGWSCFNDIHRTIY